MRISSRFRLILIPLLLVSCAPAASDEARFPIVGVDPVGLVDTMVWGGEEEPGFPKPDDFTEPLVSQEFSTPKAVVIFVKSGTCPPTAQVSVTGTPAHVGISMKLGGTIQPQNVVCEPVLTTHSLVIYLKEPIDLDGLSVTATRTGGNISEG